MVSLVPVVWEMSALLPDRESEGVMFIYGLGSVHAFF
jgi:hypothetical protein